MKGSYQGPCRFVFKGDTDACSKLTRKARMLLGSWDEYLNTGNGSMSGFNRIKTLPDGSMIQGIRVNGMYMAVVTALRAGCGNEVPGLYIPNGLITRRWDEAQSDFIEISFPGNIIGGKEQLISYFDSNDSTEYNRHCTSEWWFMPDPEDAPHDIQSNRIPNRFDRLAQTQKAAYHWGRMEFDMYMHIGRWEACLENPGCYHRYLTAYYNSMAVVGFSIKLLAIGGVDSGSRGDDYIIPFKYIGSLVTTYKGEPVIYKINLANAKDTELLSSVGEEDSELFEHLHNDYSLLKFELYRSPIDYCNPAGMIQFTTIDENGAPLDRDIQDYGTLVDTVEIDVSAYTSPNGVVRTSGDEFFLVSQLGASEVIWNTYQKLIGEPVTGVFLYRQGIKKKLGDEDWNYDVCSEFGFRGTVTWVIEFSITSPIDPDEEAVFSYNIVEVSDSYLGSNFFTQDETYQGQVELVASTIGPDVNNGDTTFDFLWDTDTTRDIDFNKYSIESIGYFEGQLNILKYHYSIDNISTYFSHETENFDGKMGPNAYVSDTSYTNVNSYVGSGEETGHTLHLRIADSFGDIWSGDIRKDTPFSWAESSDTEEFYTKLDDEGIFYEQDGLTSETMYHREYENAEHICIAPLAISPRTRLYAYGITKFTVSEIIDHSESVDADSGHTNFPRNVLHTEDLKVDINIRVLVVREGHTELNVTKADEHHAFVFDNPNPDSIHGGDVAPRYYGIPDQNTVTPIDNGLINNSNGEALSNGTTGLKMLNTMLKSQTSYVSMPYISPNSLKVGDPTVSYLYGEMDTSLPSNPDYVAPGAFLDNYIYSQVFTNNDGTMARNGAGDRTSESGDVGVHQKLAFQQSLLSEYIFGYKVMRTDFNGESYVFINDNNYPYVNNDNHLPSNLAIRGF